MVPLSVVILTKNEEKNIQSCLESCKWADEVVVVDSGSIDRTIEIAKKMGASVYSQKWLGYGKQKNFAVSKATHDWVFSLDADERISEELKEEILTTLENPTKTAYRVPRKNIILGKFLKHGGNYPDYQTRLFNRKQAKFDDAPVHEHVITKGSIGTLKNPLIHINVVNLEERFSTINERTMLEVDKQKHTFNYLNFLMRPLLRFIYHYFVKLGFLEGTHGLYYSYERAMYEFQRQAKLWEAQLKQKTQESTNNSCIRNA